MFPRQPRGDSIEFALSLRERYAGFQPRDGRIVVVLAVSNRASIFERTEKEEVNLLGHVYARTQMHLKVRRHNPDDSWLEVIHIDLPSDDLPIAAEPPLPELVTDHHVPDLACFVRKASQEWLDSEHWKKSFGDGDAPELFHILTGQARVVRHNHFKAHEKLALLSEVHYFSRGDPGLAINPPPVGANEGKPLRIFVRQRFEEHAMHNTENRRIRADSKREGKYGHHCEARIFHQHSRAITQVLKHFVLQHLVPH